MNEKYPLTAHLEDLRKRLINAAIAVAIGFAVSYYFSEQLFHILMAPLLEAMPTDSTLIFTGVAEAFFTYIKTALVAGVIVASPVIIHQIWAFIAPGLYANEKKYFIPVVIFSAFFFIGGALFGYFILFPFAFEYLLSYGSEIIKPMPSVKEYFSFSVRLLFAFGFVFELPIFIFFITRLGMVNAAFLSRYRKYAFLGTFVTAAIITPPDVISQVMLAIPMLFLYELGIIVSRIFAKEKALDEEMQEQE